MSGAHIPIGANVQELIDAGLGGNGAQAGGLRLLDLGTVAAADLAGGVVTLYTPAAGELVGPVLFRDFVQQDGAGSITMRVGGAEPGSQMGITNIDSVADSIGLAVIGTVGTDDSFSARNYLRPLEEPLLASFTLGIEDYGPADAWQAGHAYAARSCTIGPGSTHMWATDSAGTSGGSAPDYAGNENGTVLDNDITWYDTGEPPTVGGFRVLAYVATPAAP